MSAIALDYIAAQVADGTLGGLADDYIAIGEKRGKAIGETIGEARGEKNAIVKTIRNLMKNLNLNVQQAMESMGIPAEKQKEYASLI